MTCTHSSYIRAPSPPTATWRPGPPSPGLPSHADVSSTQLPGVRLCGSAFGVRAQTSPPRARRAHRLCPLLGLLRFPSRICLHSTLRSCACGAWAWSSFLLLRGAVRFPQHRFQHRSFIWGVRPQAPRVEEGSQAGEKGRSCEVVAGGVLCPHNPKRVAGVPTG